MKRTALLRKTPIRKRSEKAKKWDEHRRICRADVVLRSKGMCEFPGCMNRGSDWHHAVGRGNKGVREPDASSPELTIFLCKHHHGLAHAHADTRYVIRLEAIYRLAKHLGIEVQLDGNSVPLLVITEMLASRWVT